jgi:hypothetical protein
VSASILAHAPDIVKHPVSSFGLRESNSTRASSWNAINR